MVDKLANDEITLDIPKFARWTYSTQMLQKWYRELSIIYFAMGRKEISEGLIDVADNLDNYNFIRDDFDG